MNLKISKTTEYIPECVVLEELKQEKLDKKRVKAHANQSKVFCQEN